MEKLVKVHLVNAEMVDNSYNGGRAFILVYPDDDLAVAVTANMSGVDVNFKEAEKIANYFISTGHEKAFR